MTATPGRQRTLNRSFSSITCQIPFLSRIHRQESAPSLPPPVRKTAPEMSRARTFVRSRSRAGNGEVGKDVRKAPLSLAVLPRLLTAGRTPVRSPAAKKPEVPLDPPP